MYIHIDTDKDAFHYNGGNSSVDLYNTTKELKRLFMSINEQILKGYTKGILIDNNHEECGSWSMEETENGLSRDN